MQINPINTNYKYNPKFTAYYKMPFDKDSFEFLQKAVKPLYEKVRRQRMEIFVGEHPFQPLYEISMNKELNKSQYSKEWMRANAQNYGADFSDIDKNSIYVVTTNKDSKDLFDYMKQRLTSFIKADSLFGRIKRIIQYIKNPPVNNNVPNYLIDIFSTLDENSKELAKFNEFMKSKKVENADSLFHMCSLIMQK